MKLIRLSGRPVAIAITIASTIIACQGDDSSAPPDAGASGRGGAAGTSDATGSGGGTGGQAEEGGQSDGAGQGGASGAGGSSVGDAGPDVRADVSAGAGGMSASDASDARDATVDRSSEAAVNDAEAGASDRVCATSADGSVHVQLYSFDIADGGVATGIGDWSTYAAPGVTSSVDDFLGESSATPGALQAQITFPFDNPAGSGMRFGTRQDIERQGLFNNPADFSCFTRMHMWIKILTPASSFLSAQMYVVHADSPFDGVFGTYYSGASLDALADGNWHELVTTLAGTTSAITKYGVRFQTFLAAPADAGPGPDGGLPVPDPVDVLLDNVWLE